VHMLILPTEIQQSLPTSFAQHATCPSPSQMIIRILDTVFQNKRLLPTPASIRQKYCL